MYLCTTNYAIDSLSVASEKVHKIVKNLGWALTGKVVTMLGSFLVGIIVARYLGPDQYGLMSYVISYVALFQVLATFGLDAIEVREEVARKEDRDVLVGTSFFLKLIFAVLTIAIIAVTILVSESDSYTRWLIMLYSLSMVMNSFGVIRNHFTALLWNEYIVKTEIARTIIGAALKIALLLLHASLPWFVGAVLFDTMLIAGGYIASYQKKIDSIWKWKFDKSEAKYLIKESFPMLLSGLAVVVYQKIDQVMLGQMLNKSAVGVYAVAAVFSEIMITIPTILSQTITPVLVENYDVSYAQYRQKAQVFMNITIWICIAMAVVVCLCSYPLVRYTYGVEYIGAVSALQILCFKVVGIAGMQTSGQMIITEHLQKYAVIRNLSGAAVCVICNWILIPRYGITGSAISGLAAAFIPGFIANAIIPSYRQIAKMQVISLFAGWKDIVHIKRLFRL